MRVFQFYLSGRYAEDYRGFLLHLLDKDWRSAGFVEGPFTVSSQILNKEDSKEMFKGNGLYFIFGYKYIDYNYPLYIGITGRTFRQRLKEHTWLKNPIKWIKTRNQWNRESRVKIKLIAYLVNMPLPVAKFFESVFLSAFDFPENDQENNGVRTTINALASKSVEDGRTHFLEKLSPILPNLEKHINLIYQFKKLQ